MKLLIFLVSIIFFTSVTSAFSADLTCTVPAANITRSVELCEELRINMRVRSSEWDNNICSTQFLRIGLLAGERTSSRKTANETVATLVNDAVDLYLSTWPNLVEAFCGDTILDTEEPFNEECDDGNTVGEDGCDGGCLIES